MDIDRSGMSTLSHPPMHTNRGQHHINNSNSNNTSTSNDTNNQHNYRIDRSQLNTYTLDNHSSNSNSNSDSISASSSLYKYNPSSINALYATRVGSGRLESSAADILASQNLNAILPSSSHSSNNKRYDINTRIQGELHNLLQSANTHNTNTSSTMAASTVASASAPASAYHNNNTNANPSTSTINPQTQWSTFLQAMMQQNYNEQNNPTVTNKEHRVH
jgi:hypothetical protein